MRFMAIAAPVIQLTILGYAATTDVRSVPLVVCDADRSSESRALVSRFVNSGYFEIVGDVDSPKEIDPYIERGKASLALMIPTDFSAKVLGRKTASLQIIADGSDANSSNIALGYAAQIVASHSRGILAELLEKTPMAAKPGSVRAVTRVWYNENLLSRNYMVPAVVVLVLMIITFTLTAMAIVKEREIGTLEQLLVAPIRPYQLILGKLIPFILVGMVDVTLVLLVAVYWFHVPLRGSALLIYVSCGLFIMTTLGLGLFVSTIANTRQQAMMIAQFGFFIPFMYFSGFVFPIENMPQTVQWLTYGVPLRYALNIMRNIFLKGVGLEVLWPDALALVIIGVLILTLSILRFHRKLG
ncbi:MAG: ABC transporter permease [Nitrospinae bacterium]|nr:ABC transporter permease [Nitrospinota bacterium]